MKVFFDQTCVMNDEGTLISYVDESNNSCKLYDIFNDAHYELYNKDDQRTRTFPNLSSFSKDGKFLFILCPQSIKIVDITARKELLAIPLDIKEASNIQATDYTITFESYSEIYSFFLAAIYSLLGQNTCTEKTALIIAQKCMSQHTPPLQNTCDIAHHQKYSSIVHDISDGIQKLLFGCIIPKKESHEEYKDYDYFKKKESTQQSINSEQSMYDNDVEEQKESDDSDKQKNADQEARPTTIQKQSMLYWLWINAYKKFASIFQ